VAMMVSRAAMGVLFPPSILPLTGRIAVPVLEQGLPDWTRWREQARLHGERVVQELLEVADGEADTDDVPVGEPTSQPPPPPPLPAPPALAAAAVSAAARPAALLSGDLGMVQGLLAGPEAQGEAVRMLQDASSRSTIDMTAYSFDRRDMAKELLAAASLGAEVRVLVDQQMTMTGRTTDQLRMVSELALPVSRVKVRKLVGRSLADEYRKVGRNYTRDYLGQLHAKYLRVDDEALVGSCNWTTASRGNYEMVVKLNLNEDGRKTFKEFFEELWDRGTEFTSVDVDHAEIARRDRERRATSGASSSSTSRAAV